MSSEKKENSMSTIEMIKFWAIGMVAMIISGFILSLIFFGFLASTFGS